MTGPEAIQAGMSVVEALWTTTFTLDGVTGTFTGTLSSDRRTTRIGQGGFREDVDAVLMCKRTAFTTVTPKVGQRVTLKGKRYVIDFTDPDDSSWALGLMSEH